MYLRMKPELRVGEKVAGSEVRPPLLARQLGAGAANPRERWHDCGMIPRYPLFVSAALFALAAFLVGCSTPGNYRNDAAHEALLQTLRQCLVDVSISDTNKDFISPLHRAGRLFFEWHRPRAPDRGARTAAALSRSD